MKKNISATNAPLSNDTKPTKSSRGGARVNSGRKQTKKEITQWHIDVPLAIDNAAKIAGVTNKTALVIELLKKHFNIQE